MLDSAIPSIRRSVSDLAKYGLIDDPDGRVVSRVTAYEHLENAVTVVDLVQESIAEIVEAKRTLFAELDKLTRPDMPLASSASGLPPPCSPKRWGARRMS
jgi:L-gulonate 3-dehydrogenase